MPEYVIAIHGAIEAGIITTFVNPMYTPGKYPKSPEFLVKSTDPNIQNSTFLWKVQIKEFNMK